MFAYSLLSRVLKILEFSTFFSLAYNLNTNISISNVRKAKVRNLAESHSLTHLNTDQM